MCTISNLFSDDSILILYNIRLHIIILPHDLEKLVFRQCLSHRRFCRVKIQLSLYCNGHRRRMRVDENKSAIFPLE